MRPAGRTSYILSGETPESIVYDRAHKVLFASAPTLNQVLVIDAVTRTIMKTLPISAAGQMDISPDGSTIVVSSDIVPSLTFIDTASQSIISVSAMPAQASVFGQTMQGSLSQPVFLAGGDVLLLDGAVNNEDTGGPLVRWSHATNTFTTMSQYGEYLSRTPDGSKVLVTGLQGSLAIYDTATNSITATFSDLASVSTSDPANPRFASINFNSLQFFDTNLNLLATLPINTLPGSSNQAYAIRFSLDGTKLFIAESGLYSGLYAYQTVDAVNYKLGPLAPLMDFSGDDETSYDVMSETPLAIDETNLIYGQGNRGIAIDDPLNYYDPSYTPGQGRGFEFFKPNYGAVGAADITKPFNSYQPSTAVYFDGIAAANINEDSNGDLAITTPLISTPGPSNIEMVEPDGSFSFYPAAFTFGVQASTIEPTAGPSIGGISADIVAYGVGGGISDVTVTVGGSPASVTSVQRLDGSLPNPLPIYDVQFTVPPGTAGSTVDVSISASGYTATLKKAFTYEAQFQNYPYPNGAAPNGLVYDSGRHVLYIAAGNQVDVFSMNTRAFLSPLSLPTLHNLTGYTALDLSVDGTTLAIANLADQSIALLNPDTPSKVSLVPFGPQPLGPNEPFGANSITATSKGTFFVGQGDTAISGGGGALYELDPKSLNIVQRTDDAGTALPIGSYLAVSGFLLRRSTDATRILVGSTADLLWSGDTDTFSVFQPVGLEGVGDIQAQTVDGTISPDASTISLYVQTDDASYQYTFDSRFNLLSNDIDPEGVGGDPRYGQFLNSSGALLYLPIGNGINVYDVHSGNLIRRIGVVEAGYQYGQVAQSAISDDTGQYLFLLTANGLDVIEDAPPLSVRSAAPLPNTVASGTVITLRGSNFLSGATVTIAGKTASTHSS